MAVDGFLADLQVGGDFAGTASGADQLEDLEFAVAEVLEGGTAGARAAGAGQQAAQDDRLHLAAEVGLGARHQALDRFLQVIGGDGLHQVTPGAGLEGAARVDHLVELGEGEDARLRVELGQLGDQVQPVAVPEPEVEQDDVGMQALRGLAGFLDGAGLADAGEVLLLVDPLDDAGAEEGVIVHHQQAGLLAMLGLAHGMLLWSWGWGRGTWQTTSGWPSGAVCRERAPPRTPAR